MRRIILSLFFCAAASWAEEVSPTYYESGVISPWTAGIDYDVGFGGFFSYHMALLGGVSSQVNRAASFGDVYFGELQAGFRFYLNKWDTWEGTYVALMGRVGIYDLPLRATSNPIVVDRVNAVQAGIGFYLGYRWRRNLVNNMKGFPFMMSFEPYLGYSLDAFFPIQKTRAQSGTVHSFTVGLKFTLGFYTYYYRPGTMVTNAETGEVTRKVVETNTNALGNTNASNGATNAAAGQAPPPRRAAPRVETIGRLVPLGKDPWETRYFG